MQPKLEYRDEYTNLKKLCIKTSIGDLHTPTRSLHIKNSNPNEFNIIGTSNLPCITEIFRTFSKEDLDKYLDQDIPPEKQTSKLIQKAKQKGINFLFVRFRNKHNNQIFKPDEKDIENLIKISTHPLNDYITIPNLSHLSEVNYIEFLEKFFELVQSYRKKPKIIGTLPLLSSNDFVELCKFYFKKEVFAFAMDFNGKNPLDSYVLVNDLIKLTYLNEREYHEQTFLYALNIPLTKVQKKISVSPAKDIVSFLMGFDAFGTSHISKMHPDVLKKIKLSKTSEEKNHYHIFNRLDYGYYREDTDKIDSLFKENLPVSISIADLKKSNRKDIIKLFNVERHFLEATELQRNLSENSVKSYLETKTHAQNPLSFISKKMQMNG